MINAILKSKIHVNIVPKINTIKENLQVNKKFIYNSLSNQSYLNDLFEEIKNGILYCKLNNRKTNNININQIENNNKELFLNSDTEWWPNNLKNENKY